MARYRSKRYRSSKERVTDATPREVLEAVAILKSFKNAKFDETVAIAIQLGVDPKKSDQLVRGTFSLPNGIGKEKRVIAFAEGETADKARAAGAVEVGGEDLAKKIQEGWLDFDVAVAHSSTMRYVGKLGRVLGPQGKMPSPKSGTVTDDVAAAVREFRAGKIEYRVDAGASLHAVVGKKSFAPEKLQQNIEAFLEHVKSIRPPSAKGTFVQKVTLAATMSPGVRINVGK